MTEQELLQAIGQMMEEKLAPVNGRLDGIDKRLDGIDERLDGIDERLDGIDKRLDGIDERFDGIDERLDGIDERLDGIDERLIRVEASLDHEIRPAIQLLAEGHALILERLDDKIDAKTEKLEWRVDAIEEVLKQHLREAK